MTRRRWLFAPADYVLLVGDQSGATARRIICDSGRGCHVIVVRGGSSAASSVLHGRRADAVKPGMPAKTAGRRAAVMRAAYRVMANPAVTQLACRAAAVPFLRPIAYPAGMEFMRRHMIQIPPRRWPRSLFRSLAGMNGQVHEAMAGPAGFHDSGTLKGWDIASHLEQITVPALITSGRYDIATRYEQAASPF